jgi:hypothetical protein
MAECAVCKNKLGNFPETIVLCAHKGGPVHLGCCIDNCSWNKQPCQHAEGVYERL